MARDAKQKSKTSRAARVTTKDLRLGRGAADKVKGDRLSTNHDLTVG